MAVSLLRRLRQRASRALESVHHEMLYPLLGTNLQCDYECLQGDVLQQPRLAKPSSGKFNWYESGRPLRHSQAARATRIGAADPAP